MKIVEKMAEKCKNLGSVEGVTIAFLGDSVTQGCFDLYKEANGGINTDDLGMLCAVGDLACAAGILAITQDRLVDDGRRLLILFHAVITGQLHITIFHQQDLAGRVTIVRTDTAHILTHHQNVYLLLRRTQKAQKAVLLAERINLKALFGLYQIVGQLFQIDPIFSRYYNVYLFHEAFLR